MYYTINTCFDDYLQIVAAYKQYMVDVSQLLGATSGDASIFSNDMFHYEKRIAEITPANKQEDPFNSHRRFKLSKLKEIAGMVRRYDHIIIYVVVIHTSYSYLLLVLYIIL